MADLLTCRTCAHHLTVFARPGMPAGMGICGLTRIKNDLAFAVIPTMPSTMAELWTAKDFSCVQYKSTVESRGRA